MPDARTLVVTGTSTGIGRAIAVEARRRGWTVVGTIRDPADVDALEAEGVSAARCDITDSDDVAALAALVDERFGGRLDGLVNNAGTTYAAPVELFDLEDIRRQFEVNVVGHIGVTQALLPALRAARGTIVMISSVSAARSAPLMGAYSASKRALESFAESLDLELAGSGVRTLVVRPGAFETAIWGTSLERAEAKYQDPSSPYYELGEKVKKVAIEENQMRDPTELATHTLDQLENPRARFLSTYPLTRDTIATKVLPWPLYRKAVEQTLG